MTKLPYEEFCDRVGVLHFFKLKELEDFALESLSISGYFNKVGLPYLIEYCHKHPEFHICSVGDKLVRYNRLIDENNALYYLCRGDKDPALVCYPDWEKIGHVWIFMSKLIRGTATPTEIDQFKNRYQIETLKN